MGDLFDGYGSTLAPRKTAAGVPAFDEMFGVPTHPGALAESRQTYRELYQALAQMTQEELRGRTDSLASSYLAQGVTFDFAGEERPFPLDAVPRIIDFDEWSRVESGIKQRVRALEAFLDDAYGHQHCVRDGVLPAKLIASSQYFYRQASGIHSANGVRIHVSGIDLIRDEHGEMRVLEDNVRVPSGVSYVISNRRVMAQTLPELFVSMHVRPVGEYPNKLLQALQASAPPGVEDPNVVVLTPGVYNSAYFEHTLLARLMGVELVEGRDLLCSGGKVFMRTTRGLKRVDVIYRRVDDDFIDPLSFRADSMLGAPGLMLAARLGNVTIANAVGNGVADDKLLYTYVPDLIKYYLAEEPILKNVDTWRLEDPGALEEVLDRLPELVVKPVDGSGGKGLVVGPDASPAELDSLRKRLIADPRGWIAQPVVMLSTIPTLVEDGMRPRHADLRPFAVNDGDDIWVLPGGLTRVALPENELVVNSSQGGGSKDTWIVGGSAPGHVEYGQGQSHGLAELVDEQASTQAIPIIYDDQATIYDDQATSYDDQATQAIPIIRDEFDEDADEPDFEAESEAEAPSAPSPREQSHSPQDPGNSQVEQQQQQQQQQQQHLRSQHLRSQSRESEGGAQTC